MMGLAVLDEEGDVRQTLTLAKPVITVGRVGCDLSLPDDPFLSPVHAEFAMRDGQLFVRDVGSHNHTWLFLDEPHTLEDGDRLFLGSQFFQFRLIAVPKAPGPDADGTHHSGSAVPEADKAVLAQLRATGTVRDQLHLSLGRAITIGRDTGDWTFPYDQTMSGRHAEIREQGGRFVISDLGSRNGTAVAIRGETQLEPGQRVLVGEQVLRVERV